METVTAGAAVDAVRAGLKRVDALLQRAVQAQQSRASMREKGQYWGSTVSDLEVGEWLGTGGEVVWASSNDLEPASPTGRVAELGREFDLSPIDLDLLLLAVAPEVSAGYSRVFAYLNDDLGRPHLTIDVATRVLAAGEERLTIQQRLLSSQPLVRHHLLQVDGASAPASLRPVRLADGLLDWLLGGPTPLGEVSPTPPTRSVPRATEARIDVVLPTLLEASTGLVLGGTEGSRRTVAEAIAHRLERPLHELHAGEWLARTPPADPAELIRDLRLQQAVPYLVGIPDADAEPEIRLRATALRRALVDLPTLLLVGGIDGRSVSELVPEHRARVTIPVARSSTEERVQAWTAAWEQRGWPHPEHAHDVAERFHTLSGATIDAVLDRASQEAGQRAPDLETLWGAARQAARPELKGLAQRIVPRYTWSDLILPPPVVDQLQHLQHYLAHQETVLDHWGGRRARPRGYGLKALFSGAPGTGKTMCAEVLAGALGLDLYKVDISSVISRWVGETEKNLREIFDAAEGGSAVLLFDEADALFGARGDVKQAQDRFANQEVSYLLQRLEVFEGCAVLTTNLQDNIDEAFLRRFGAVIEFPMPSAQERAALWARALPERAPRSPDLDLDALARQFVLSGGSIVNAAIHGCVVAAAEDQPVGMRHVVRAVARELVKMGRQVNQVRFGAYFEHVQDMR